MNKIILTSIAGSMFWFSFCFASIYENGINQNIHDKYCGWMDQHSQQNNNTSHHVSNKPLRRSGFQNQELPTTSTSQTFGNTTYHTYDPVQQRQGFLN